MKYKTNWLVGYHDRGTTKTVYLLGLKVGDSVGVRVGDTAA